MYDIVFFVLVNELLFSYVIIVNVSLTLGYSSVIGDTPNVADSSRLEERYASMLCL